MLRVFAVMAALTALPAKAMEFDLPLDLSAADPVSVLASAEQVIPLVRRTREIEVDDNGTRYTAPSDLRVSMVVLDHGVGTDLSPRRDVYIALWNVVPEFGIAWALEPLAAVYGFEEAKRLEAGIYQFTASTADYRGAFADCTFPRMRFTVDARQLSVDVRQARGLEPMETLKITRRPSVEAEYIDCADG